MSNFSLESPDSRSRHSYTLQLSIEPLREVKDSISHKTISAKGAHGLPESFDFSPRKDVKHCCKAF